MAVRDTRMWRARSVQRQEISILGDEHTILPDGKRKMLDIVGTEQCLIGGCRYIHTTQPEPVSNAGVDMFIKMKSNLHQLACRRFFVGGVMGCSPSKPQRLRQLLSSRRGFHRGGPSST